MNIAEYAAPQSLDAAIGILRGDAAARPLAGGNSLLVEPHRSQISGAKLVDLGQIPGLVGITSSDGGVRIGAMTTIGAVATDGTIAGKYAALAEAAQLVGDVQVRNRATIGGNVADRDIGVDLPAALLALRAQVQIQGPGGTRSVSIDEALGGALGQGDLITAITLPAVASRSGSAYEKFKHPATLYALCGVAASVTLTADGTVSSCGVALTGAVATATRLAGVEAALQGKAPDAANVAVADGQLGALSFQGDRFGSAEYRAHLARVLTQRAISAAVQRAG